MNFPNSNRRAFLQRSALGAGALGLGELSFISHLPALNAEDLSLPKDAVSLRPDIEPLTRLIEETARETLLEKVAEQIKAGTSYQDILSALMLAGVRNIQPRPVGFKFHAVLVVHSAHLASIQSPSHERWLPIFWALDYFKDSQARDIREGNWTMKALDESKIPSTLDITSSFRAAMDEWNEEATDFATAGLVRSAGAGQVFDLFAEYGCRDYRDIGHKAIFVANSWRTLQVIGWRHAEPILRSLAYALLQHNGPNPGHANHPADRAGRQNQEKLSLFRKGWQRGRIDDKATLDFAEQLRHGSDLDASDMALELINANIDPQSIWDAVFNFSGELLGRHPGIVSLHAITTSNALHYAYQHCQKEMTRKKLLLQACSFMPLFRGDTLNQQEHRFDQIQPETIPNNQTEALESIFSTLDTSKQSAAAKVFQYLEQGHSPEQLMNTARRYLFLKGSNSHDYKFASAVLEDFYHVSPSWRHHYLAASVFHLKGSKSKTNSLVERTRTALS